MQIVIDIPNWLYNAIMECKEPHYSKSLGDAVRDGVPLPKGHGRLIDVNDLFDRIGLEDNDRNREDNVGEIITLEDFDFISTIIEAYKAESEEV